MVVTVKESRFLLDMTCKTYFQPQNLKPHSAMVLTMYDTMGQLKQNINQIAVEHCHSNFTALEFGHLSQIFGTNALF